MEDGNVDVDDGNVDGKDVDVDVIDNGVLVYLNLSVIRFSPDATAASASAFFISASFAKSLVGHSHSPKASERVFCPPPHLHLLVLSSMQMPWHSRPNIHVHFELLPPWDLYIDFDSPIQISLGLDSLVVQRKRLGLRLSCCGPCFFE